MAGTTRVSVLFVCMGNICRSPTAEGVFRHQVEAAGLSDRIEIDSAGVSDYHCGDEPDRRAQAAAARRKYDLSALRARQVSRVDFERFDYVLAMDRDNLAALRRLMPKGHEREPQLFLAYASSRKILEVPDPYYGGPEGFELVLDLIEDASRGLLEDIRQRLLRATDSTAN